MGREETLTIEAPSNATNLGLIHTHTGISPDDALS
jgi:hypothetical protein